MVRFSNGFYTFSDSHFKTMRKQDLINYIRTIEKNWENQLMTNAIQYDNCKRLLAEERNKAIDEFASELENHSIYADTGKGDEVKMEWVSPVTRIKEIAEQMKGGGNNG